MIRIVQYNESRTIQLYQLTGLVLWKDRENMKCFGKIVIHLLGKRQLFRSFAILPFA